MDSVQFELGKTYSFYLHTWNEARTMFGPDNQHTVDHLFGVQATAFVTPISQCELSLELKNVNLLWNDTNFESQQDILEFVRQLENPVFFGYENGQVTEFCDNVAEESATIVQNLKRSVISTFQTTSKLSSTGRSNVSEIFPQRIARYFLYCHGSFQLGLRSHP